MECKRRLFCLEKVSPVTNRTQLMQLSFSDIRRIAAARASVRLHELMKQQEKTIPRGKMALNSTSAGSLLPAVSNRHIKILNETWANMIQHAEYHGVRIIARCLAKNPGLARLFPKLPACKRCKSCRSLRSNSTAIQCGHILLMHITDIITNLRNNTTLKNYIRRKVCLLREAGVTKEDIEMCQDELISYLAESQPSKWSAEASSAWKLMSAAIITLGTQEWNPPIVRYKKKDMPRANSICDFRSVSSQY